MFLSPPRPLVVKPSVLQLQQFGIPSHSISLISKHFYLLSRLVHFPPSDNSASDSSMLEFVRYTNFVILLLLLLLLIIIIIIIILSTAYMGHKIFSFSNFMRNFVKHVLLFCNKKELLHCSMHSGVTLKYFCKKFQSAN